MEKSIWSLLPTIYYPSDAPSVAPCLALFFAAKFSFHNSNFCRADIFFSSNCATDRVKKDRFLLEFFC